MHNISVISLISYDAHYLVKSISSYYKYVNEIVLGLDQDRITWSGNKFSFKESKVFSDLQKLDVDGKIVLVEDNFHESDSAIANDNYERNFLKSHCTNDWILSVDADEQLLNAKEFFYDFCPLVATYKEKVDVCMTWATPYKTIGDTTLVIVDEDDTPFFGENQGVLTSKNSTYTYARWTDKSASGANRVQSPLIAIHWSLCRDEKDLHEKIHNIGHSDIVETDPFFKIWKNVTLDNYKELRDFKTSGLGQAQWPKLLAVPTNQVENFYKQFKEKAY